MTGTIFINYRREDSISIAGRLYDRLSHTFGRKNIFMDVDHIPAGVDFEAHLNTQVDECEIFLVVIGPRWLEVKDENGGRRLDNSDDFVNIEIKTALARDIRVIPVLVDGAGMPKASELPDRLKQLARRQAVEVRQNQFGRDAEALVERIREALAGSVGIRSWRGMVLAGAATVATLLLVGWFGLSWISAPRPAGIVPSPVDTMNRIGTVTPQEGENERQRLTDLKAEQERQAKATADQEAQRKAEEAERQRLIDVKAEQAAREEITIRDYSPFSGAKIANLSRALADELQLQNVERGVAIMDLKAGSVAGRIGFRRGDVVEEVNGKRIAKTRELERLSSVPNSTWAVTVLRGGQKLSVVLGYTSSRPPR